MDKIYCEDCKDCKFDYSEGHYNNPYCNNKNNRERIQHAVYKEYGIQPPCETANHNNNCKYYERKKIAKIINYLKGVKL